MTIIKGYCEKCKKVVNVERLPLPMKKNDKRYECVRCKYGRAYL